MSDKKLPNPKKKDRDWQEKVAKNLEKEGVKLDHPQGFERFRAALKQTKRPRRR